MSTFRYLDTYTLPDGGMPVYLDDVMNLEKAREVNDSAYSNVNCVLSGCEITNINTSNKTCDIGAGVFQTLGVRCDFDGATGVSYPFILRSLANPVQRDFLDGDTKTIGYTYTALIQSLYGADIDNVYGLFPAAFYDNGVKCTYIYFNPFTFQKLDNYLRWKQALRGETRMVLSDVTSAITVDDVGDNITGSAIQVEYATIDHVANSGYGVVKNINSKQGRLNFDLAGWETIYLPAYTSGGSPTGTITKLIDYNQKANISNTYGTIYAKLDTNQTPRHMHEAGTIINNHKHLYRTAQGTAPPGDTFAVIYANVDTDYAISTLTEGGIISGTTPYSGTGNMDDLNKTAITTQTQQNIEYANVHGLHQMMVVKSTFPYIFF